jgi:hypothetical protein
MSPSGAMDLMSPSAVQAGRGLHYLIRHTTVYTSHGVAISTAWPREQ